MTKLFKLDSVNGFQVFVLLRFSFAILTSIAMAKSGISLSEIGVYEALMLVGGSLTFFWMTGLLNGLLPVYPTLKENEKAGFVFNIFILFITLSSLVAGLMWYFRDWIALGMTNFETLPYFNWLCLWITINLPTFLIEYLYILLKKPKQIIVFGVYSFLGQFLIIILPLMLGYSMEISFIGLVILAATKLVWLISLLFQHSRVNWNFRPLIPYLWIASPIALYTLTGGMMNYIDGVVIMKYYNEEIFAIYRNGAREFPLALALLMAMSTALVPNISEHLSSGLGQIKHRTKNLMYPLFGASIFLMFISKWAYPIVFSAEFADSALVFNIYLLALISRILLPQTILIGLKKTKAILWASLIETAVNLGLSLLLIQSWGIAGVAAATIIAFTLEKVLLIIYTRQILKIKLSSYLDVKRYIWCTIALIGSYILVIMFQ